VSNQIVIRFLRRVLLIAVISVCGVLLVILVASQVGQHIFRNRAELLLAQVQSLELGKTSWQDAQRQLRGWVTEAKRDDPCNKTECSELITLTEPDWLFVPRPIFVRLDDYLRWRLRLSYNQGPLARLMQKALFPGYMLMGGRPARILATIGMRDGVVWSKGFSVSIETYWHNVREFGKDNWIEYELIADIHSVTRFDFSRETWEGSQLVLHPNYLISRPSGCEICVLGYVHFTPNSDPGDIHRLMQLDFSCLTRMRPCVDQIDIMPAAWKQYLAERSGK
jgi:hypothetical protein